MVIGRSSFGVKSKLMESSLPQRILPLIVDPTLKSKKQYLSCLTLPDGRCSRLVAVPPMSIEQAKYEMPLLPSFHPQGTRDATLLRAGNHRLYQSSRFTSMTVASPLGSKLTRPPALTQGSDISDGYLSFPIRNGKVDMTVGRAPWMPTGHYRMWAASGVTGPPAVPATGP